MNKNRFSVWIIIGAGSLLTMLTAYIIYRAYSRRRIGFDTRHQKLKQEIKELRKKADKLYSLLR